MKGNSPSDDDGVIAYSQLAKVIAIQDLKPEWILS
jgi:hypothetical protein